MNTLFAVTATGEEGKQLACFVGDAHFHEGKTVMVDEFRSLSGNRACGSTAQESDISAGGDGQGSVAVGSCGKGEVSQREQHAALYAAAGIEVAWFNGHLCAGIAFAHFNQLDAASAGKFIVEKGVLDFLCVLMLGVGDS